MVGTCIGTTIPAPGGHSVWFFHYNDILEYLYYTGGEIEKKPSIYKSKTEEDIRDYLLMMLELRYESATATGETFNKSGKTDILLKYHKDSSNLFVAECKYWHGISEFHKAISQLFDRYITWRDSKAAIILFVKNQNFSDVLEKISSEAPKHKYFKKTLTKRNEGSNSFVFHIPNDKGSEVYLEILSFHFPE